MVEFAVKRLRESQLLPEFRVDRHAVAKGFEEARESVEAVGVDAVAGGFGKETGAEGGAILGEAKLLHGAEEGRVELVEGNSRHGSV